MTFARRVVLALLVLGVADASAHAAPITLSYDFSATNFVDLFNGVAPPVDPVTGSFSVTFDNAATIIDSTSGISFSNLNIDLGSAAAFWYLASSDTLILGGLASSAAGAAPGTDDFLLALSNVSTSPTFFFMGYAQDEVGESSWSSVIGTLTPAAVPEPASLACSASASPGSAPAGGGSGKRSARFVGTQQQSREGPSQDGLFSLWPLQWSRIDGVLTIRRAAAAIPSSWGSSH